MANIERQVKDNGELVCVGETEESSNVVYVYKQKSKDYADKRWAIDEALLTAIMPSMEKVFVVIREVETRTEFRIPRDVAVSVGKRRVDEKWGCVVDVGVEYFAINGKPPKTKVESVVVNELKAEKERVKREAEEAERKRKEREYCVVKDEDGETMVLEADEPF